MNNKSSYIAKGGLFVTLTLIVLYLTTILKFNTLFMLGVASAIIPLALITTSLNNSILVFIASSILCYFLVPVKSVWMLYTLLFGPYGIVKFLLERLRNTTLEILLKLLYFNLLTFLNFYLYKRLFVPNFTLNYNIVLILIGVQFVFYLFDYALTVFINAMRKYKL
ncbi:hypothetical protein [Clostridium tunisiense]|uniref:hypothetical protein n=1 Tax=Clostridium tunisiense TaxID=219748 RepID=UPI0002FF6E36|nr:hypothetical protein [Clostridium tunisiense]